VEKKISPTFVSTVILEFFNVIVIQQFDSSAVGVILVAWDFICHVLNVF